MINTTPLFRLYSALRLNHLKKQSVSDVQTRQLLTLVRKAQLTRFGKQYDFKQIKTVEEYQRIVPLRTYDDFWQDFWGSDFPELIDCAWPGKIRYFAMPSGTTSGRTCAVLPTRSIRTCAAIAARMSIATWKGMGLPFPTCCLSLREHFGHGGRRRENLTGKCRASSQSLNASRHWSRLPGHGDYGSNIQR